MTHLIPDVCGCHVLRILAVAVCRIRDVCCLPAPTHQPFSFNSLGLNAPEKAFSTNVRASGTLKLGMKVFLRFYREMHTGLTKWPALNVHAWFFLYIMQPVARTMCGWNLMQDTKKQLNQ